MFEYVVDRFSCPLHVLSLKTASNIPGGTFDMDKTKTFFPQTMNIELTTNCPLHCPQCYCSLTGGKNIDLETAIHWIKEAGKLGVTDVMLSGGETMCYPHLYEVIAAVKKHCGIANVALSGFGFTQEVYEKMIAAGIGGIFISLNGSTKEINALTRDGYELAISALALLQKNNYPNTTINWVMHSNNADDFENVLAIAEQYGAANLVVIGVKPDSRKSLPTIPSLAQMLAVRQVIRSHKGNTKILIESCYSPMLALTSDTKLLGNLNIGINKGCGAGRTAFSVSVDGLLSPCRHLEYYEKFDTIAEYWEKSDVLKQLRLMDNDPAEPCRSCRLLNYCRPCAAINSKLENKLYRGNSYCPMANKEF